MITPINKFDLAWTCVLKNQPMQKLLSQEEQSQLYAWIDHAATRLSTPNPKAMATFLRALVNRGAAKQSFLAYLRDFGVDNAESFIDELFDRIQSKNFHFEEDKAPPPQKPPLPPKETKPEPQPKQEPVKTKPEEKRKDRDDESRKDHDDVKRKDRPSDDHRRDHSDRSKDRDDNRRRDRDDDRRRDHDDDRRKDRDGDERRKGRDFDDRKKDRDDDRRKDKKDKYDDHKSEPRRGKWTDFKEKERPRRSRYRDSDDEAEDTKPDVAPPPKYIIYIAGLEPAMNTIPGLWKLFGKYGRILGIETLVEQKVAFIEYDQLLGAFRAAKAKRNPLGNSYLKIGYAVDPEPEALAALQREWEERTKKWNEEKERKKRESEKPPPPVAASQPSNTADAERDLLDEMVTKQQELLDELEKCTDPVRKEALMSEIRELDQMMQQLNC